MAQEPYQNQSVDTDEVEADFNTGVYLNRDPFERKRSPKSVWLFLILSLGIVGISGYQIYRNIVGPLEVKIPDWLAQEVNTNDSPEQDIEALKQKDTDRDGLNDYQEIYQYNTSIFLEDTDSDNLTDYQEVNNGTDPVCPEGQSCNLLKLITPQTKFSDLIQDISLDPNLTVQQAAAAEFRKFLADNGMPKEDLDILTDDDLIAIFRIFEESQVVSDSKWSATSTPEEIRAFLLAQPGANESEVKNLSDEVLLKIRDKLISEK